VDGQPLPQPGQYPAQVRGDDHQVAVKQAGPGQAQHGQRAQLLVALLQHGPQRISQLGGHVGISQGTASTLAEALVRDGLIERRTDPRDGRATQVALTRAGQERARAWLRDYEAAAGEVFAVLLPGQRRALLTALPILSAERP
jgi:DNA-binding MarR family transcriptional regulator